MSERPDKLPGYTVVTLGVCALVYVLMLIYGTLYPFHGWAVPAGGFSGHFLETQIPGASRTDLITNLLVYMPAGLFLAALLSRHVRWPPAIILAGMSGVVLSLSLETAQVFLPSRMSSLSDLLLNGIGALFGATVAFLLSTRSRWGARLHSLRGELFLPGVLTNIGLIVLSLWVLSQLSPLVPSLAISNLRDGLKPVWHTVTGESPFVVVQSLVYVCNVMALGGIVLSLSRSRKIGLLLFTLLVLTVLLLKVPVLSRQLSLEALFGCSLALLALLLLRGLPPRVLVSCALLFLLTGYVVDALRDAGNTAQLIAFNWVPFRGHMQSLVGMANILASAWVFLGVGYSVRYLSRPSSAVVAAWTGALLVAGLAFYMEIQQLSIPRRVPDITDVLIAVVAWGCAWTGMRSQV